MQARTKDAKYDRIKEKKVSTTVEALTRGLPEEFFSYVNYCRNLKFDEKPDYSFLRQLFKSLMHKSGFEHDYVYDWIAKKNGPASKPPIPIATNVQPKAE